jgi:catechol 2,3-dioxygenase-like lactoylglutathione lyase family enzyme
MDARCAAGQRQARVHITIYTADLERSVGFYEALLGAAPRRPGYADLALSDPPLVLALQESRPAGVGTVNHLGISLPDLALLQAIRERLAGGGYAVRDLSAGECSLPGCAPRGSTLWVSEPDGTRWEIYVESPQYQTGDQPTE